MGVMGRLGILCAVLGVTACAAPAQQAQQPAAPVTKKDDGGPVEMVELETQVADLAVDATHIYVAQPIDGVIKRIAKSGGLVEIVAEEQPNADSLVVVDDTLYWTTYEEGRGEIRRWGRARNKWSTVAIETGEIRDVAPRGSELVYVVADDAGARVRVVPRAGGTSRDLAQSDASSFVAIAGDQVVWGGGYKLWRATAGSSGTLVSDQFQLLGLVTRGEDIYTWDDHVIRRFSPGTAAVTVGEGQAPHCVVSGEWLVIGDKDSLRAQPSTGSDGSFVRLAPDTSVAMVAADDHSVYWVDTRGEGPRVFRAPLPAVQTTAQSGKPETK